MMKAIKLIWYLIKIPIFLSISFLFFLVAAIVRVFDKWAAMRIFKVSIRLYFKFFGLRLKFEFPDERMKESSNTVFVLLNQFSFLDSMVCPILPVRRGLGIMNIEMALYPILGWFLGICNFVIVRQWPAQAKRVMNRTSDFLRRGGNMIISIEGKRSPDGKLSTYKKGPVVMAINNQSDVVPFIIEGTWESLPIKSLYTQPGKVNVKFLEPISTTGMTYEDRDKLKDRLLKIALENGLR